MIRFKNNPAIVLGVIGAALLPLALLLAGMAGVPGAKAAPNASWYVNAAAGDDGNSCTAPGDACATIGTAISKAIDNDVILIAAGTYQESGLEINAQLTLQGAGAESTIIDGGGNGRILAIFGDGSTLTDLTLQNGANTSAGDSFDQAGGALYNTTTTLLQNVVIRNNSTIGLGGGLNNAGELTIENSRILSNTSEAFGGGLYNSPFGTLTMTNVLVEDNLATGSMGGGIHNLGDMTFINGTVQGNRTTSTGGGIRVEGGTLSLQNVTVTGNEAASGAGILISIGTVTMTNSTVSGNIASNNQSGIYAIGNQVLLTVVNSTIADNTRTSENGTEYGGLNAANGATVSVQNSIIAYNAGIRDDNCLIGPNVTWVSNGNNLASDFSCDLDGPNDLEFTDPLLAPLGDYGGPTLTHALLPGSPAIDAGSNSGCPPSDQRGVARPYDGDNDSSAICDIGAVEAEHQLQISDISVLEGSGGPSSAVFTVTLSPQSDQTVTVDFMTVDGTAVAPADYTATSDTLTFNAGVVTQTITVPLVADSDDESNESFTVQLSNPANAAILFGSGAGTIVDDDGLPELTIADETILEGNSGSKIMEFTVTLSPASGDTVTVDYATVAGTAAAGNDFTAVSDTLIFSPGTETQTISVPILGDIIDEGASEAFSVQLSNGSNAVLGDDTAVGTITDNETATLSQNVGPQVGEGNSGTTPATFTVTLSSPAAFVVTVDYSISSGVTDSGAIYGEDFTGDTSGTLTFQPGETEQTYGVDVIGDVIPEPDENFSSLISNGSVGIQVNGSNARILNDDGGIVFLPFMVLEP